VRALKLRLKREPFEVMVAGDKHEEFRLQSDWIESRLYSKDGSPREYDQIEYVNGYGQRGLVSLLILTDLSSLPVGFKEITPMAW